MDSTKITADNLRKVAEYMGYETKEIMDNFPKCEIYYQEKGKSDWWNARPISEFPNSDQCLELLDMLYSKGWRIPPRTNPLTYTLGLYSKTIYEVTGDTLNEAVTLAAIAYVDNSIGEDE